MVMMNQNDIAKVAGISRAFLSNLIATRKRPSWKRAKQLAEITGTDPVLWLEGSEDEIRAAISKPSDDQAMKG